jgi:protein-S-isoprenylcysteine O-methyltransferase Ste14
MAFTRRRHQVVDLVPDRAGAITRVRKSMRVTIRPSTTRSTAALWAKSLLNAVLFFGIFMLALPWLAHRLLPVTLPIPMGARTWLAGGLALVGVGAWIACLDTFSRRGRGTPLPLDAPRHLVTTGLFAATRNPIMAAELLVIWSEALYLASWGVALYAVAITVAAHVMVRRVEEPELRERFGESYEEYCKNVPRWFPRLRSHL